MNRNCIQCGQLVGTNNWNKGIRWCDKLCKDRFHEKFYGGSFQKIKRNIGLLSLKNYFMYHYKGKRKVLIK